jgi:hypothetical protein
MRAVVAGCGGQRTRLVVVVVSLQVAKHLAARKWLACHLMGRSSLALHASNGHDSCSQPHRNLNTAAPLLLAFETRTHCGAPPYPFHLLHLKHSRILLIASAVVPSLHCVVHGQTRLAQTPGSSLRYHRVVLQWQYEEIRWRDQ